MRTSVQRVRIRVDGVVQGVGFRPLVHRLATQLGLHGSVRNDERGVVSEVEGEAAAVDALIARLPDEAPPLAVIEDVRSEPVQPHGDRGFLIAASAPGSPDALVSPDVAVCADCLCELFDPADRRHRYPFITCTNCRPRFTIVRDVPYDRPRTTMADFTMCAPCEAEYHDPADRRFHVQPNACPSCGPTLHLQGGSDPFMQEPLRLAMEALRNGAIVAVMGSAGFISRASRPTRMRSRCCGRKYHEEKRSR
jgi:hydrogenase maturation protein HypF